MRRAAALAGLAALVGLSGVGLAIAQDQPSPPASASTPPQGAPTPGAAASPPPGAVLAAPPPEEAPAPPPVTPAVVKEAEQADDTPPTPPPAPPEPLKRPRLGAAVLQGVDKITAATLRFEARVGEPVRYKGLVITVHACETTASDEADFDSIAHLDVQSRPEGVAGRAAPAAKTVFRGWTFASSPGLHPFVHPVYDLWLIACKAASPQV